MKKLLLATLAVTVFSVLAWSQSNIGGTCTRTSCDGPKFTATCSYTSCDGSEDLSNSEVQDDGFASITIKCNELNSYGCVESETASIIIHCSQTDSFGCVESNDVASFTPKCLESGFGCVETETASIIIHCSQTNSYGGCVESNA